MSTYCSLVLCFALMAYLKYEGLKIKEGDHQKVGLNCIIAAWIKLLLYNS